MTLEIVCSPSQTSQQGPHALAAVYKASGLWLESLTSRNLVVQSSNLYREPRPGYN